MCLIGEEELDEFRTEAESATVAEPEVTTEITQTNAPVILANSHTLESPHSWDYLLEQYDWDVNLARAIMLAESEGNPNAVNWNDNHGVCVSSRGLFQIACLHTTNPDRLYDPVYNIETAYRIWQKQGWQPWGAFTDKRYLQYLE